MENKEMVQLGINPDLIKPIVENQIKSAILAARGGADNLVESVVNALMTEKVNEKGQKSSYSGENKYNWFDVIVTNTVREAIQAEIKNAILENANVFKDALVHQLTSKSGANAVAKALIDGLNKTFESSWRSKISISFVGNDD